MIEVPESSNVWVSLGSLGVALWALFRDRRKDAEKAIKDAVEPIKTELAGHKADYGLFKTGIDDTMRNHVVYRRDFDDYKRDLRREFEDMKEMLGKITDILLKRGGVQ